MSVKMKTFTWKEIELLSPFFYISLYLAFTVSLNCWYIEGKHKMNPCPFSLYKTTDAKLLWDEQRLFIADSKEYKSFCGHVQEHYRRISESFIILNEIHEL